MRRHIERVCFQGLLFMPCFVEETDIFGCLLVVNPLTAKSCVIGRFQKPKGNERFVVEVQLNHIATCRHKVRIVTRTIAEPLNYLSNLNSSRLPNFSKQNLCTYCYSVLIRQKSTSLI